MKLSKKLFILSSALVAPAAITAPAILSSCSENCMDIYLDITDNKEYYVDLDKILHNNFEWYDAIFENQNIEFKQDSILNYIDTDYNPHPSQLEIGQIEINMWTSSSYYLEIKFSLIEFITKFSFQFNPRIIAKNIYIKNKKIDEAIIHLPPIWIYANLD